METSYGIFAVQDGKVLVIKQVSGKHWTLCKGHKANKNESDKDTAIRELKEEVNLCVERFLSDKEYTQQYSLMRKGRHITKRVTFFLAKVTGTLVIQERELLDAKFMSFADADKLLSYNEDKNILQEVMRDMS